MLDVPGQIAKEEAYQNTIINPGHPLSEGALLTLLIEPLDRDGSKRVKDLQLLVGADGSAGGPRPAGEAPLAGLRFQLKDAATALNKQDTLLSVIESLAALDRKKHDYFLTVTFGDTVTLGQAGMLARILATIDREQGCASSRHRRGRFTTAPSRRTASCWTGTPGCFTRWNWPCPKRTGRPPASSS